MAVPLKYILPGEYNAFIWEMNVSEQSDYRWQGITSAHRSDHLIVRFCGQFSFFQKNQHKSPLQRANR
jgi:hypothetical protein